MPRKSDKRERLIAAGKQIIYQQGYARTTLAHIASAADVPLGNVYYHFKTKESLAQAVIESRMDDLRAHIKRSEQADEPEERLVSFLTHSIARRSDMAAHGCPYGSLAQELDKAEIDNTLRRSAAEMLKLQLDWMTEQFLALGKADEAEMFATQLLAAAQGYCLIAHTMDDCSLMVRGFHRLAGWIRQQAHR